MDNLVQVLYVDSRAETAAARASRLEREAEALAVETAADASAALDRVETGEFDCVVTACEFAGAGEFLAALQDEQSDIALVLVVEDGDGSVASAAVVDRKSGDNRQDDGSDAALAERIRTAVDDSQPVSSRDVTDLESFDGMFPDVVLVVDETGHHVSVVDAASSPPPYDDPQALSGQRLGDVLPDDTADLLYDAVERTLDTGEPQTVQYHLDTEAETRWFEARVAPAEGTRDGQRQTLWVVREITERKEHESALEALHEMATAIQTADSIDVACELTVTAAADILEFELCSVVLREGDWLVPRALSEDAPPEGVQRMRADEGLAGKTLQTGEPYVVDDVMSDDVSEPAADLYRSGLSVPIGESGVFQAVSTEPEAFDDRDVALAELLVSHTRTALDRIERERDLTRKTERLEEFASFVSHDLRNPLNVAALRLDLVREECDSEHLAGVGEALDRMERLIDELLTLAREGATIGETEPVELADIAAEAWGHVDTDSATLDCRSERVVRADRARLTAVLENLFRNAVEHGGADVTVSVADLDDGRGVYVADDGTGIPAEEREAVFESGYSTAEDGTGFGLTIVRDIVEAHGWSVALTESEAGGARFEVTGVEFAD